MSKLATKTIKLGDSADTSKNFLISVPATPDGSLTIERENGTDVLTVDASGKVVIPGNVVPAFSVHSPNSLAFTANVAKKLQFGQKEYDLTGAFDAVTNYRFQPAVAGYYQISGSFSISVTSGEVVALILRNGLAYKRGSFPTQGNGSQVSALVYLNGTTDYVELWGQTSVSQNASNSQSDTYFQGVLVRAA